MEIILVREASWMQMWYDYHRDQLQPMRKHQTAETKLRKQHKKRRWSGTDLMKYMEFGHRKTTTQVGKVKSPGVDFLLDWTSRESCLFRIPGSGLMWISLRRWPHRPRPSSTGPAGMANCG